MPATECTNQGLNSDINGGMGQKQAQKNKKAAISCFFAC